MVYRIYVEKKEELANEARELAGEARDFLGIQSLEKVRILNRYDVENIDKELFDQAVRNVFSEPQLDQTFEHLPETDAQVFAVEFLPGQYDQRADSAAQCIQIISQGERPAVHTAKVYLLYGNLSAEDLAAIKKHVINPVESREASLDRVETLATQYEIPEKVDILDGFTSYDENQLAAFAREKGLAMDLGDLICCRDYFRSENRDPSITEIRVIDTYWSDHCRHTTFNTVIDSIETDDPELQNAYDEYIRTREELHRTKPVTLMDMGTIGARYLKSVGMLDKLDESEEINACTVKIKVNVNGEAQDWLLLFKNETHNHPTEIEPFGGAATCIGGAIRDPLSGRSYVYSAMRVTGAANPLRSISETLKGKLPQKKLVTTAAAGYSSYGNQIGLATGQVDELYHDGYAAKRMEIGAVVAAAPAENVRRERPSGGDVIILLGGRTGRDGCGGATGSSKAHTVESLDTCGAEVQKGNAPEERKLQRLFRNPEASRMIKRCNDFGAGGVSVAVGELADGLDIALNAVPKKYDGLDGTELAISESQERMAVVVAGEDAEKFRALAAEENLESTVIAKVTEDRRLKMKWNGATIVDISRDFLDTNGAEKHMSASLPKTKTWAKDIPASFNEGLLSLADDLNVCSKRGLSERFDSTIGAGTVLMPFGGKTQTTPIQAMVNKVSCEKEDTDTCSVMAWGFNPFIMENSPYHGAYLSVVESVAKLIATGAGYEDIYLSFQEYFPHLGQDPEKWGQPVSALLGAFRAQKDFGVAAIGGKDSMSGTFEDMSVPPTLVSFAITTTCVDNIVSNELKGAGHSLYWFKPDYLENGLPDAESLKSVMKTVHSLVKEGKILAAYTPGYGGVAEALMKMCFGNRIGVKLDGSCSLDDIFGYRYGSFIVESEDDLTSCGAVLLGTTSEDPVFCCGDSCVALEHLSEIYENKLESVYPMNVEEQAEEEVPAYSFSADNRVAPAVKIAKPKVLIPVFPGTNCEYDSAKAFARAGADPEIVVIRNMTSSDITESIQYFAKQIQQSQIIFIPGGFSGGDEPEGSAKFITAFFRNQEISDAVSDLLENRDGLMAGICNGFQALVKLGLVPYGKIMDTDASCPTLTYNTIGRHQSMLVRTRIASNMSPWLANTQPGEIYTVPISHGEGRFYASRELVEQLAKKGQIATQYVDLNGVPTMDIAANPNGSICAIEGITSPDGRVFGKMGHAERVGYGLYKNVEGDFNIGMFDSAVKYFK